VLRVEAYFIEKSIATPPAALQSLVDPAGRIRSACYVAKEGIDSLDVRCSNEPAPRR